MVDDGFSALTETENEKLFAFITGTAVSAVGEITRALSFFFLSFFLFNFFIFFIYCVYMNIIYFFPFFVVVVIIIYFYIVLIMRKRLNKIKD